MLTNAYVKGLFFARIYMLIRRLSLNVAYIVIAYNIVVAIYATICDNF